MKKHLLSCLLACAASVAAMAVDPPTHLLINTTEGVRIDCLLEHRPTVTYSGDWLTIIDGSVTYEYPVEMIHKYRLGADTDIDDNIPTAVGFNGDIAWQSGTIVLSGFKPGTAVTVVSVRGIVCTRLAIDEQGNAVIRTSEYQPDVYVIHADKSNFKFIKR